MHLAKISFVDICDHWEEFRPRLDLRKFQSSFIWLCYTSKEDIINCVFKEDCKSSWKNAMN